MRRTDKGARKKIAWVTIIVIVAALTAWRFYDARALDRYAGPYLEVQGIIANSTFIGKREIFGPYRFEIELDTGRKYIVTSRSRPLQFDEGDLITLQLPDDDRFVQHDMPVTNKFTVEKTDRVRFD